MNFSSNKLVNGLLIPVVLILSAFMFQSVTTIGFEGWNDDARYVEAAVQWRDNSPFVGHNHWSIRHSYVVPLSWSMSIFHGTECALSLPSLIAYLGTIAITFYAIRPQFGTAAGVFCSIAIVITPISAVTADASMIWQFELLMVLCSFWLLWYSKDSDNGITLAVLAGLFAGLAMLTRASSGAYLVGLALLFVFGVGPARRNYLIAALSCAAVIFVDMIYFKVMTDEWLYRLKIITNHGAFTRVTDVTETVDLQQLHPTAGHLLHTPGDNYSEYALININNIINPYLMLFVHYYFGATYWLGAAGVLRFGKIRHTLAVQPSARTLMWVLLLLGATWYLVGLYILALRPHPRYWGLTSYTAALFGGLFFAWLWQQGKRWVVLVVLGGLIGAHLLLVEMNTSSIISHRWLADYIGKTRQSIYLEESAWRHGKVYFSLVRGVNDRIRPLPDENATRIWVNLEDKLPDTIADNPEQWTITWERSSRVTWLGKLLDYLDILKLLPEKHRDRLVTPEANVVIYERKSS